MKVVQKKRPDVFDDIFDNFFRPSLSFFSDKIVKMQTDLREKDNYYYLDIDLAGFNKDNINITLDDGYLTVEAVVKKNSDEENEQYIRRERHLQSCSRSYYVGDVCQESIEASYQNGVLTIKFPKMDEKKCDKKYISIN